MLQFLNPIWLFGIGGIVIPLVIHLWNVKTGKTLKVGSIKLMGESARQNSRSLKLTDLILLIIRCLIIILASMLLAQPIWDGRAKKAQNKAWVLAEKENLAQTYGAFKSEIDSLINAGAEFHFLEPGFKKADLNSVLNDTSYNDTAKKLSYWSLIMLLEKHKPLGSQAFIFTDDRLNRFQGAPPHLSAALRWKTYTPADSTSAWIEHAYLSSAGSITALLSESNPRVTMRKPIQLMPGTEKQGLRAIISGGTPQIKLKGQVVVADTGTVKIAIMEKGPFSTSQYVVAAVNAIRQYSGRKIKVVKASSDADILFWLSDHEIPGQTLKNIKPGSTIFRYATGRAINTNTWLHIAGLQTSIEKEPAIVHKRFPLPAAQADLALWEDGFGQPLLTLGSKNDISYYTLYTRFDPEWTDLVWSAEFVKLLMPVIVLERTALKTEIDKRSIPRNQLTQSTRADAKSNVRNTGSSKPEVRSQQLNMFFWLLLVLFFITERWFSHRNNTL